jgi:predicted class III extradiol MEMO1 family dioxygenase
MNDKMMQLFKQFGITQFDFTSVKGHDRVDGYYTVKLVMNILKLKQEQMMQVLTYSTVIEKSKLEFILNETKNIKHQPLVFFF